MGRTIPGKQSPAKPRATAKRRPGKNAGKKKNGGAKDRKIEPKNLLRDASLLLLECGGLSVIGMGAIIILLGHFGNRFSGTDVLGSLLPFGIGIFSFIVTAMLFLNGWKRLRRYLKIWSPALPAGLVVVMTLTLACLIPASDFTKAFGYYRTLVGGKEEAGRMTLAHQVYAAYRRLGTAQVQKMIERARPYASDIEEAAKTYGVNPNILKGLAATESSYMPRKSEDGGHGLFQITLVPKQVREEVDSRFKEGERDLGSTRYNAFMGAATFRHYLEEMNNDLFLGLLAYNIGPANGGLRFIMQQYGATDFVTIQPYLLKLPRDYPIRVLSYGLAFRIEQKEGRVLAYEEGDNAMTIQSLGIPGL